ncbi:MAG TPA: hypothetical protein DCO65_11040 [Spartobacteria bacterium]|nr:hypothetical protein [Spartobacteria bacterium]
MKRVCCSSGFQPERPQAGCPCHSASGSLARNGHSALGFSHAQSREVGQAPFEIKPQQESVWICMCGLSKNQPLCDGTAIVVSAMGMGVANRRR